MQQTVDMPRSPSWQPFYLSERLGTESSTSNAYLDCHFIFTTWLQSRQV